MVKIEGRLSQIGKPVNGLSKSGKEWVKTEFIIETEGQYPKLICVTDFGKCDISNIKIGSLISVSVDISSVDYKGRWFTNITGHSIDILNENKNANTKEEKKESEKINKIVVEQNVTENNNIDGEDLPF